MRNRPFHPRAYLSGIRNVDRGLLSRTRIITTIEDAEDAGKLRTIDISKKSGLGTSCVTYHLKLLAGQKTVISRKKGRYNTWMLTRYGQERLST